MICSANQLTGFYMMGTLIVKEITSWLKSAYPSLKTFYLENKLPVSNKPVLFSKLVSNFWTTIKEIAKFFMCENIDAEWVRLGSKYASEMDQRIVSEFHLISDNKYQESSDKDCKESAEKLEMRITIRRK